MDSIALGERLIEDNIYGLDILAYAVQVCASTLLLSTPGTIVNKSQLWQMPFGGPNGHLGSLDLLYGDAEGVLFGAFGTVITPDGSAGQNVLLQIPKVDLVIMNPPFTSSNGGSRILMSLDPGEFLQTRKTLDRVLAQPELLGRLAAGLGALFVPLADRMISAGGRIALVLPKTMLTGLHWDETRELLSRGFHIETVISSHEAGRWNFSDSTALSEVLLIARKLEEGEDRRDQRTTWVQLTR